MASTFNLLTAGGARFNKEKYSSDFGLFKKPSGGSRKGKEKATSVKSSSTTLPSSIDFFHDQPHSSHHPHHKPSKALQSGSSTSIPNNDDNEEDDEDDEDDDDEEDDEGSEEIAPPQQKITLTGAEPLPKSLTPSLLSLISQSNASFPGRAGTPLLKSLRRSNITSLWGVQCAVAGCLLDIDDESGLRRDVICVAPTGSGKTLSYILPTIVNLRHPARELREEQRTHRKVSLGKATVGDDNDDDEEEREVDEGDAELDGGRGIRAVVVVPTHDLAIQIQSVAKAVMAGRAWRIMVLAKATERAVCISSPGKRFAPTAKATIAKVPKGSKKDKEETDEEQHEDEDEVDEEENDSEEDGGSDDDDEILSTGSVNEFAQSDDEEAESPEDGDEDALVDSAEAPLGIDLLIATPERLHHLVQSKQVSLAHTRHLIFDESDRLLSDDFRPQVLPILKAARHSRVQKCFLSATMPSSSEAIAKKWLRDGGVRVVVGVKDSAVTTVAQSLLYTGSESGKILALRNLISTGKLPYPSLIFVQSVERAEELYKLLVLDSGSGTTLRVEAVHGGKSLAVRDKAIEGFRKGDVWVLVVTEVLARGMDFRGVKVVVNYDFPQTVQSYIHRIGRTARAGLPGTAITFFSDEDAPHLRTIANVLTSSGCKVPEYMLEMKKPSKNLKRFRAKIPVSRKQVGGGGRDLGKEIGKRKRDMIEGSKRRKVVKSGSTQKKD